MQFVSAYQDLRGDPVAEMIGQLRWQDGVDLGIITFLIYRLLQILRGSRAMQMVTGLAVIMAALFFRAPWDC